MSSTRIRACIAAVTVISTTPLIAATNESRCVEFCGLGWTVCCEATGGPFCCVYESGTCCAIDNDECVYAAC